VDGGKGVGIIFDAAGQSPENNGHEAEPSRQREVTIAQVHVPIALSESNLAIRSMTKKVEPAGWLYFKDEAAISPYQLFTEYKADMGLSSNDTMILTKSAVCSLGLR
jgi:hypothetical protein